MPLLDDEEDVSYDIESLFTSIPIDETIEYVCDEIYKNGKLEPMCKRSIFKKLLLKLTKECTFSANDKLFKQIDGVSMGGPASVVLAGCFVNKMERDVVVPLKPKFYRRFVDDTYNRRKKGVPDILLQSLEAYHPNIKFTYEISPKTFLDTKIERSGNQLTFRVKRNDSKLPFHWQSAVPKKYKRNLINGDLHRAKRISSDFPAEKKRIKEKFRKACYPAGFINSVIESFDDKVFDDVIIPRWLFEEQRTKVFLNLPYCPKNEQSSFKLIKSLQYFTGGEVDIIITWKTRKIRSLFPIKDRVTRELSSYLIYKGSCSCGLDYIGETKRNAKTRWLEHDKMEGKSEPSKHISVNDGHSFTWTILTKAPVNWRKRKILEAYYIRKFKPPINDQLDIKSLTLFRNGIT